MKLPLTLILTICWMLLLNISPVVYHAPKALAAADEGIFGKFEAPLPKLEGKTIGQFIRDDCKTPLLRYVSIIINYVTVFIVIISVILIVIGGFIYMTAGGDSTRLGQAKTFIMSALLGIALALTAYLILNTVSSQFTSDLAEPTLTKPGEPVRPCP